MEEKKSKPKYNALYTYTEFDANIFDTKKYINLNRKGLTLFKHLKYRRSWERCSKTPKDTHTQFISFTEKNTTVSHHEESQVFTFDLNEEVPMPSVSFQQNLS